MKTVQQVQTMIDSGMMAADIGCGLNFYSEHPEYEWLYIDGDEHERVDIVCDFSDIPLPNECVSFAHSSETLEHIRKQNIDKTLREWNRIMKVGATIKMTTPNLEHVIKAAYLKKQDMDWTIRNLFGDQNGEYHQHYHLYTRDTVIDLMSKYGFGEFEFIPVGGDEPEDWWWLAWQCKKIKNI